LASPGRGAHLGKRRLAPGPPIFNVGATKKDPAPKRDLPMVPSPQAQRSGGKPVVLANLIAGAICRAVEFRPNRGSVEWRGRQGRVSMNTAAVRRFAAPSPDELVERARAMVPEIRALAEETERHRTLLPQVVEQIRQSELLRTCRPRMFGGFEYDGEVALRIALTISAACASTGWTVN